METRIDLLVPGLFGPVPVPPADLPHFPSLASLLSRADSGPANGSDAIAVLFERFGIELDPDQDPPSAPFSRLVDVPDAVPEGYWLHADPVHLRPDRDRLVLFDARHLGLEQEEVDSLVELFNGHFAAEGLRLEAPAGERWYLHLDAIPRLRSSALANMVGRGIEPSYLGGEDAARWRGLLNEVQMLFHHAEVNQRRESGGKPRVSGIWLWGGGSLPTAMPQCRYSSVFSSDTLARGLAKGTGTAARPLPDNPRVVLAAGQGGRMLLFWDSLWSAVLDADATTWVQELSRFAAWLNEMTELIRGGEVREVTLYPCDGTRLAATRWTLRRFWRRPVGFASRLQGIPRG